MKYIDFVAQTIILLIGGTAVVLSVFNDSIFGAVLYAQLLLGSWQYPSSLLSMVVRGTAFHHKKIHFAVSTVYLLLLVLFTSIKPSVPEQAVGPFLVVIPWALGIFYYVITWKLVFPKKKSHSSFLPHVNF